MNRLIKLIGSCDLSDVASLRRLYEGDNKYDYNGVSIQCGETHRTTPEYVKFTLGFSFDMLWIVGSDVNFDIMTADYCLRQFAGHIENIYFEKGHKTGKERFTGKIYIHNPTQTILLRNSAYIRNGCVYIAFIIRFPVHQMGTRNVVAGKLSVRIVQRDLARAIRDFIQGFDTNDYKAKEAIYRRQREIRKIIEEKRLVSFIANGSILPRDENDCALNGAVPFTSPPEDEIELRLSDGFILRGMAIKEGVTVVTGGGYSGKSTLLDSMLQGVYDHIPGDGREYCITREKTCKITAEDGRCVTSLDISPFIRDIGNLNTKSFTTQHASGSTSQASNIMEAISAGCGAMLIDEDRTATNFMIRDARMKKIIKEDPVIPFTDRVRRIFKDAKVSTVLVIGGSSEYLDLADNVYIMQDFRIYNYNEETDKSRQNTFEFFDIEDKAPVKWKLGRTVKTPSVSAFKKDEETGMLREFVAVSDEEIYVGSHKANVSHLATVISQQQITALMFIARHLFSSQKKDEFCLLEEIRSVYAKICEDGFDDMYSSRFGINFNMELPAIHDILFAVARMNGIAYK